MILIAVHLHVKQTSHRTASFIGAFGDGDIRAANIRYFFPEGCQAPRIEVDPIAAAEQAKKKLSNEIENGKKKTDLVNKNDKGTSHNVLNNAAENEKKKQQQQAKQNNVTSNTPTSSSGYQYGKQSSSLPSTNGSCCDELRPQLLFPRANDECGGGSKANVKIVIPIDLSAIEKIPMKEIVELTAERVSIEMIRKLAKLAEKYQI